MTNQQYADALNWAKNQGGHITVTSGKVYKYNSGSSYPYCDTTTSSSYSRITWNGITFGVTAGRENHPMGHVSWYGSVAYANWRSAMEGRPLGYNLSTWACNFNSGYRLPTEAEWEKAARGGASGRRFPWSDSSDIQHARANYYSSTSYSYDTSPTRQFHPDFDNDSSPYTSPVGHFAANGYGLYDMAGNVWEWCNDWYSSSYDGSSPYGNPSGSSSGTYRVLRGGGWYGSASHCRVADRNNTYPDYLYDNIGFRSVAGELMPSVPADFDGDYDVHADDLSTFESCASAPMVAHNHSGTCRQADFDDDGDVDQSDFGILQGCLSGAGVVADPDCVE